MEEVALLAAPRVRLHGNDRRRRPHDRREEQRWGGSGPFFRNEW